MSAFKGLGGGVTLLERRRATVNQIKAVQVDDGCSSSDTRIGVPPFRHTSGAFPVLERASIIAIGHQAQRREFPTVSASGPARSKLVVLGSPDVVAVRFLSLLWRDNHGDTAYCLTTECSRAIEHCLTKSAPVASSLSARGRT